MARLENTGMVCSVVCMHFLIRRSSMPCGKGSNGKEKEAFLEIKKVQQKMLPTRRRYQYSAGVTKIDFGSDWHDDD